MAKFPYAPYENGYLLGQKSQLTQLTQLTQLRSRRWKQWSKRLHRWTSYRTTRCWRAMHNAAISSKPTRPGRGQVVRVVARAILAFRTARKWVFLVNFKTLWDWDYIWYCTMMYYVIYWLTSWRGFSGIQSLWWVDNGAGLSISASSWLEDRHQEPPCRASKAQSPSMAKAKRYYLQHHSRTGSQLDVAWLALMN